MIDVATVYFPVLDARVLAPLHALAHFFLAGITPHPQAEALPAQRLDVGIHLLQLLAGLQVSVAREIEGVQDEREESILLDALVLPAVVDHEVKIASGAG